MTQLDESGGSKMLRDAEEERECRAMLLVQDWGPRQQSAERSHVLKFLLVQGASCGHANVVQLLHQIGADINAPLYDGVTLVHMAAENGHVEVVRLLHQLGADVTAATSTGATPVCVAREKGHLGVICLLAELGSDVST